MWMKGREAPLEPWRRIFLWGAPNLSVGCFKKPRSALLGVWGNFDGLSTLRVACSHHASRITHILIEYEVGTEMVTCGFAHDSYRYFPYRGY